MILAAHLDILLLLVVCLALMAGFPVAFTLAGVALVFAGFGSLVGVSPSLGAIPLRLYGIVSNPTLVAVPLFIAMGLLLERSKVAEELLEDLGHLLRCLPGGLALSVTLVGAFLAASTGIVGATVVTMGLIALPTMLSAGYMARISAGSIAAAGTLGQIIPPSIVLVILADQLSTAYQSAQRSRGSFAPEPFSVADLFAAAALPGLVLVGFYLAFQLVWCWRHPLAPQKASLAVPVSRRNPLRSLIAPVALIICVLGSILGGVATPTEAAALGAAGALVLAGARQSERPWLTMGLPLGSSIALVGFAWFGSVFAGTGFVTVSVVPAMTLTVGLLLNIRSLYQSGVLTTTLSAAVRMTSMVFAIMIGASIFALVFRDLGGDDTIRGFLENLPGGTLSAIVLVMALVFVLGFFLDFLEIVFVVVPLVAPVLLQMEMGDLGPMSPAWLGVMLAVNLQTSFLTPPFGVALFYLRGVAPDTVRTSDIYFGAAPFVVLQLCLLVCLWFFPQLATWLPGLLSGL